MNMKRRNEARPKRARSKFSDLPRRRVSTRATCGRVGWLSRPMSQTECQRGNTNYRYCVIDLKLPLMDAMTIWLKYATMHYTSPWYYLLLSIDEKFSSMGALK